MAKTVFVTQEVAEVGRKMAAHAVVVDHVAAEAGYLTNAHPVSVSGLLVEVGWIEGPAVPLIVCGPRWQMMGD